MHVQLARAQDELFCFGRSRFSFAETGGAHDSTKVMYYEHIRNTHALKLKPMDRRSARGACRGLPK